MAYTIEVNSVEVSIPIAMKTNGSLDQWAGKFNLSIRDAAGTFAIANGNTVVVKDTGTAVFGGYVQRWKRKNGAIIASGLDYTAILTKVYVNEVYTATAIHTIVKDLMDKYAPGLTYVNVYTTTTAPEEVRLRHVQLFKALQLLAKYEDCSFFIDETKDLHFGILGSTDSGIDLVKGTNILADDYETNDDKLINSVKVTGGREDYTKTQTFTPGAAATYVTLENKPVRARVTINGTEKVGFKEGMSSTTTYDYYLDKEALRVYFNVAFAGTETVVVEFDYTSPIIVIAKDDPSVSSYTEYGKVIYDETINKKADAQSLAAQLLAKYSQPVQIGNVTTRLNLTAHLGETVDVTNTSKSVSGTFIIVGLEHNYFSGGRKTTYQLASLNEGVIETISEIIQRVEVLEELQRGTADLISYLKNFDDSLSLNDDPANNLTAYKRTVNTTDTWYFGVPETFDGTLKFGGGSGAYGANQIANPSA